MFYCVGFCAKNWSKKYRLVLKGKIKTNNDKIILLLQKVISIKNLELSLIYNFKIMSSGVKLYF